MKKIICTLVFTWLSLIMFSQTEIQYTMNFLVQNMITEVDGNIDSIQDYEGYRIIYVDLPKICDIKFVDVKLTDYTSQFVDVSVLANWIKIKKDYFIIYSVSDIMCYKYDVLVIEYNAKKDKMILTYEYFIDLNILN